MCCVQYVFKLIIMTQLAVAHLLFTSAVHIQVIERKFDALAWLANQLVITKDVIWVHSWVGG